MPSHQATSGPTLRFAVSGSRRPDRRVNSVWQRWRSLHREILNHARACERLGVCLTIEQLAEELDEALGLVERRVEELSSLQLIHCGDDRLIELDNASTRMCG